VMLSQVAVRTVDPEPLSRLVFTINCCVCGGFDGLEGMSSKKS
jgi:hypothetical protein